MMLSGLLKKMCGGYGLSVGALGERVAAGYLKKQKYKILGKNLRFKIGEIDLLARSADGCFLVLVEVKTREFSKDDGFLPEYRVGRDKQRKQVQLARLLMKKYGLSSERIRFDVIGVQNPRGRSPIINHYVNAFESSY